MTNNIIHRGEILEKTLRKSGYSFTKLAGKLGISRNTLYKRFENANLSYHFIMEVGKIIYYDFTLEFPEMKEGADGLASQSPIFKIQAKYTRLLENYNELLAMITRMANQHGFYKIKQEIVKLIDTEKEEKG